MKLWNCPRIADDAGERGQHRFHAQADLVGLELCEVARPVGAILRAELFDGVADFTGVTVWRHLDHAEVERERFGAVEHEHPSGQAGDPPPCFSVRRRSPTNHS